MERIPVEVTMPMFAIGGFLMLLSLLFCCYLWRLKHRGEDEAGFKQIKFYVSSKKTPNETCPVCLEDFKIGENIALCPCSHAFHSGCLMKWLQESCLCPMCKMKVKDSTDEGTSLMVGALPVSHL